MDKIWRIGDEVLEVAVDGVDRKDGVLPDVGVTVLEARAAEGNKRLKDLHVLGELLEEAEGSSPNVFVGMLLE